MIKYFFLLLVSSPLSYAKDMTISMIWINKELGNHKYLLPEDKLGNICGWAETNPKASLFFWYDGKYIVDIDQATDNTFNYLKLNCNKSTRNIRFMDIRKSELLTQKENFFESYIPIFLRVDLLRLIVLHSLSFVHNSINFYADIDIRPINIDIFRTNKEINKLLREYGFMMASMVPIKGTYRFEFRDNEDAINFFKKNEDKIYKYDSATNADYVRYYNQFLSRDLCNLNKVFENAATILTGYNKNILNLFNDFIFYNIERFSKIIELEICTAKSYYGDILKEKVFNFDESMNEVIDFASASKFDKDYSLKTRAYRKACFETKDIVDNNDFFKIKGYQKFLNIRLMKFAEDIYTALPFLFHQICNQQLRDTSAVEIEKTTSREEKIKWDYFCCFKIERDNLRLKEKNRDLIDYNNFTLESLTNFLPKRYLADLVEIPTLSFFGSVSELEYSERSLLSM